MRHRGGAGFAFHLALLEILYGDIAPHVSVKIQQHLIESHQRVTDSAM